MTEPDIYREIKDTGTRHSLVTLILGSVVIVMSVACFYAAFFKPLDPPMINTLVFWFGVWMFFMAAFKLVNVAKFEFNTAQRLIRHSKGVFVLMTNKIYRFDSVIGVEGRLHSHETRHDHDYSKGYSTTMYYCGYLVFADCAVECVRLGKGDEVAFTKCVKSIGKVVGAPVKIELKQLNNDAPNEKAKSISILRILLLLLIVAVMSVVLHFYVLGWAGT